MSVDWVLIGKVAVLSFNGVGLIVLAVNYFRRRRNGVTPWRPPNSLILGYDAPRVQIEHPTRPSDTDGQLPPPDCPRSGPHA